MKASYNWLLELLDGAIGNSDEVASKLTMAGLEVASVEKVGKDTVFLIELTPNRPDCLSIHGIARELSVITGKKLKISHPKINPTKNFNEMPDVKIADPGLCPRYCARLIKGIKVAKSPDWMVERLEKFEMRSVNNIVDITNYVLLEFGHPLHAFDLDLLAGKKIIVRKAKPKEKIIAIDGNERELAPDMLVIADAEKPVAIAGVMGGKGSEINDSTVNVLLESAYFNPISVRKTARRLSLHTEASHRFERGADFNGVIPALERVTELILQLNPDCKVSKVMDVYPKKPSMPLLSIAALKYRKAVR